MLVVAALGGNALLQRGQPMTAEVQRQNARIAARSLAGLIGDGHRLVVTHGNGPQIGMLALQGASGGAARPRPLDVLGAETEGMIGYLIEQELENALAAGAAAGPDGGGADEGGHVGPVPMVATLLTQVEVDPADPAFARPTKFVGPVYDEAEARQLARALGWQIARDGTKWRRVVPSPLPRAIPDIKLLRYLAQGEVVVICAGGGGIPVARRPDGSLVGVEAVIDKDRASALLATELGADALLMLTDVDAVYRDWGTPRQAAIGAIGADEAAALALPEGSMGPKVEAGVAFLRAGGRIAGIGSLSDAARILRGEAGTRIRPA